MKTTLILILSTLWRSPKKHLFTPVLLIFAWPGASIAQAQAPVTVGVWGDNGYGQTTVPVAAQSGVTAIAAGGLHIVALTNDGSVVAWGDNSKGQTTVPVAARSGVTAIAAGYNYTVALAGGVALLPYLTTRISGNQLSLSWPTNAAGFTLQSTLNLTPPVTWTDSTQSPAVIGTHFTVTNAASVRDQFYRLSKP